jgi:23S rRNA (guanosine2251-2'-O)-methyltransferase
MKSNTPKKILILHDIRSSQNVGAMFRTADAAGITEIILSGTSPAPLDKFQRVNTQLTKASLGAEQTIPWKHITSLSRYLTTLKKEGVQIIAIEQSLRSIDYKEVKAEKNVAFIVGNEVEGIEKAVLDKIDIIAEIPMKGEKESLNVSVALGIALFRILNI